MARSGAKRNRLRGAVDALPSGALRVRVYAGEDPLTGKRHSLIEVIPPGPHAAAQAEAARVRLLNQVDERRNPRTNATVDQLLDRYLEALDVGYSTQRMYTRYLELHARPFIGHLKAGAIDSEVLDSLYREMRRCRTHCTTTKGVDHRTPRDHECDERCRPHVCSPLSPTTVRQVHFVLNAAFGKGVRWRWLSVNPVEIDAALPDYLGIPGGRDIGDLLDQLTAEALTYATSLDTTRPGAEQLPDAMRLSNGDSMYQAPGARLYATPEQVRTERALVAATTVGGAAALRHEVAQRFLAGLAESGIALGADQAAAVRGVLTSGARVETLIGPAGTGKSFVVGTIARGWTDPEHAGVEGGLPRRVVGLATSQIATEVLKSEGVTASNVAAWLGAQRRLAAGAGSGGPRPIDTDQAWRLHAGDLVVVDESAMTDTAALAAIHGHVDAAGAKLLLVGDHRQLAAVGAGGGMDLIAASGTRYELAEARRFTHEWERDASLRLRADDASVLREYHQQGRLLDSGTVEDAESSAARAWLADTLAGRRSLLVVDTNEQAARVSAQIRAELVRLGHVQEDGVRLGLQGTYAGVGDLVEARKLDWSLAGHEGNPRGAINREHYRVQAVRPDGGLDVAVVIGRTPDGDVLGDRLVLPRSYVAEHLALGYASTVHAAQGATVDTTHTIVTNRARLAWLYVALSRGRDANTAHVATLTAVDDHARGNDSHTLHRDPIAVLSRILDAPDHADPATRSAVATATDSATEATSARTAAELLADASQLAATERTATWLDQLTDAAALTPEQRARIAADDGAATLTRILRRAELAGHDPRRALHDAVTASTLDGARNLPNVLYSRIRAEYADRLDPVGDSFRDWAPQVENPQWRAYLAELAAQVDERAETLGREAATAGPEAPGWAIEAFGAVPTDDDARAAWARDVGRVAAYREMRGHDTDTDPLGAAPSSGQVEQYAAYRAAWRALGRPDIDRDVMEMTDGQLRMRVRSAQREETWGPRYVGNELAGTRQAADEHRRTAELRAAEATAAPDPAERERLRTEAAQSRSLADTLDQRAAQLQEVDDARAHWLTHSAMTRVNGATSAAELSRRHLDDAEPEPRVTATEWLDAHRDAVADDDTHRPITDTDLRTDEMLDDAVLDSFEIPERDIREVAEHEPPQRDEDRVRVASADETAAALASAHRSLFEISMRTAEDDARMEEERAAELARWSADDHAVHDTDHDVLRDEPERTWSE